MDKDWRDVQPEEEQDGDVGQELNGVIRICGSETHHAEGRVPGESAQRDRGDDKCWPVWPRQFLGRNRKGMLERLWWWRSQRRTQKQ